MKVKRILLQVLTALPALMVVMSGVMKLIGGDEITKALDSAGVAAFRVPLGLMEISFAALYLIPRTARFGFLLLTCYFAGAIATDLSHGRPIWSPAFILALIWIAMFAKDRQEFLGQA